MAHKSETVQWSTRHVLSNSATPDADQLDRSVGVCWGRVTTAIAAVNSSPPTRYRCYQVADDSGLYPLFFKKLQGTCFLLYWPRPAGRLPVISWNSCQTTLAFLSTHAIVCPSRCHCTVLPLGHNRTAGERLALLSFASSWAPLLHLRFHSLYTHIRRK